VANGKVGASPLDLAMCSEWRGFADKFRTMISALGVDGWRDFEDGLYDVPANADGSIGFEAFEEFLGLQQMKEQAAPADTERADKERVIRAKNMDIVQAAKEGRIADVKFVLQHAPERVNDQNEVLMLHTHTLLIMAVAQYGTTALHWAAWKNSLEVAEVLVAANANADIKNNERAGCNRLGAEC